MLSKESLKSVCSNIKILTKTSDWGNIQNFRSIDRFSVKKIIYSSLVTLRPSRRNFAMQYLRHNNDSKKFTEFTTSNEIKLNKMELNEID